MTDLFTKPLTKKEQMYRFIKEKKWVRTSEAIKFGLSIYTNRGDRYCRDLATEGKIMRMPDEDKKFYFGVNCKEDIWQII